jgi:hypothetical protein
MMAVNVGLSDMTRSRTYSHASRPLTAPHTDFPFSPASPYQSCLGTYFESSFAS